MTPWKNVTEKEKCKEESYIKGAKNQVEITELFYTIYHISVAIMTFLKLALLLCCAAVAIADQCAYPVSACSFMFFSFEFENIILYLKLNLTLTSPALL